MAKPDLTFTSEGMFTRFDPETDAGERAWAEMLDQNGGTSKVLTTHAAAVAAQLRSAGYVVHKARPRAPMKPGELEALLAELAS